MIPNCSLELTTHLLQFYGAQIADRITEEVTHIIMDQRDLSRLPEIRSELKRNLAIPPHLAKHVVGKEWVEESCLLHEDLDEGEFYIRHK